MSNRLPKPRRYQIPEDWDRARVVIDEALRDLQGYAEDYPEPDTLDAREPTTDPELHRWTDLRAPASAIQVAGSTGIPSWDTTNGGWAFDDAKTEQVFLLLQFPHSWVPESPIVPHVHWIQSDAGRVAWRMQYKWVNNGADIPGPFEEVTTSNLVFRYTSGNFLQISTFGEIDASGKGLSSMLSIKLARVGGDASDTHSGDATLWEFDIHYRADGLGSQEEFRKVVREPQVPVSLLRRR